MSDPNEPWFVGERSEALAGLLLTARPDVHVRGPRKQGGVDFVVEVTDGPARSTRVFLVEVKGTLSSNPEDCDRVVAPLFRPGGGERDLPACVFVINVRDTRGVYAWLAEPVVQGENARLKAHHQAVFHDLDAAAIDQIVGGVTAWYDARRLQLMSA